MGKCVSFSRAVPAARLFTREISAAICQFLVFKDKNGKIQIHRNGCKYIGQAGHCTCGCPVRLSYKTMDSYIGKLRAFLHSVAQDGEWDKRLGLGNPASDKSVKDFFGAGNCGTITVTGNTTAGHPFLH